MTLENAPTVIFAVLAGLLMFNVYLGIRTSPVSATEGRPMRTRNLILAVALFTVLGVLVALTVVSRADAHHSQFHGRRVGNQAWQWKWEVWLPAKWQRIGACETGYGKRPGRWDWNSGTYQGAFGFHHQSWDAFKPVAWWPREAYLATPWQQYQTALAIHRRYGFSGCGCRNA